LSHAGQAQRCHEVAHPAIIAHLFDLVRYQSADWAGRPGRPDR